ncbi:MAG: murein transglycosylase [Gammaproteobacteria bacterium]|nr:MAG: murein transglycosylase [Gammaproteobacteria bacterium]
MTRQCWPCFLIIVSLLISTPVWAGKEKWTNEYDGHFRKYSKRYFGPNIDWHWFKAQGIAESALNSKAKSSAGAKGIMQILPSTFGDIQKRNPHFISLTEPRWNIAAGIYYDRQLYRNLTDIQSFQSRLYMTFAGYNAGYGGVLKALKKAPGEKKSEKEWDDVYQYLPRETRGYVKRIVFLKESDLKK